MSARDGGEQNPGAVDAHGDRFDVHVLGFPGDVERAVAAVAHVFEIDPATARSVVQRAPLVVKRGASRDAAMEFVAALSQIGAEVALRAAEPGPVEATASLPRPSRAPPAGLIVERAAPSAEIVFPDVVADPAPPQAAVSVAEAETVSPVAAAEPVLNDPTTKPAASEPALQLALDLPPLPALPTGFAGLPPGGMQAPRAAGAKGPRSAAMQAAEKQDSYWSTRRQRGPAQAAAVVVRRSTTDAAREEGPRPRPQRVEATAVDSGKIGGRALSALTLTTAGGLFYGGLALGDSVLLGGASRVSLLLHTLALSAVLGSLARVGWSLRALLPLSLLSLGLLAALNWAATPHIDYEVVANESEAQGQLEVKWSGGGDHAFAVHDAHAIVRTLPRLIGDDILVRELWLLGRERPDLSLIFELPAGQRGAGQGGTPDALLARGDVLAVRAASHDPARVSSLRMPGAGRPSPVVDGQLQVREATPVESAGLSATFRVRGTLELTLLEGGQPRRIEAELRTRVVHK
ncbi:MAG: hypothetical protein OEZ06_05995 [Myxococcales bacterium]|nr:hypothetical protein [Myxococcales bacterium]